MTSFLVGKSSSLVVTSAMSTCQTTDIVFVKWFDNKPILLASSIYGLEREDQCQRWSTKDRVHVTVNRPAIVSMYNKSMGAVDMSDRIIVYHNMEPRTRKWNFRVIAHFIDVALSNCWIENRIDWQSKMQVYDFIGPHQC